MRLKTQETLKKVHALVAERRDSLCKEKTKNFLKGLPSTIRQNGFGPTLAFMQAKKEKCGEVDYRSITNIFAILFRCDNNPELLMSRILEEKSPQQYRMMQDQAIEYAGWIKQFALALPEGEERTERESEK